MEEQSLRAARSTGGRGRGNWALTWAIMVMQLGTTVATLAADPREPTSSRAAREQATARIPLKQLSRGERAAVEYVLNHTSIYRRLPTRAVDCDPKLYAFLVENPEVIVNLWEVMGIGLVTLDRTGPDTFRCADGQGTLCNVKVLHHAPGLQVVYAEGSYDGPLFRRPVKGKCVLLLRSRQHKETNGRYYVTSTMDTFIHLERGGVHLIAKTFQPLIGKVADYNFVETVNFVSSLSRTAEVNPDGIAKVSPRLKRVAPDVQEEFASIAANLSQRSAGYTKLRRAAHQQARRR